MSFGERDQHGLGKSIADVLRKTPKSKESNRGFLEVDINTIIPPKENPRQVFAEEELQELAESIRMHGILQPMVVLKRNAGYEVLSGERRYRAAKICGLDRVPVVIRDYDSEQECAELRLIENIQRQDLNPVELAQAYQELIDQHHLTQDELAHRLGKKRSSIANCLRLLTLPGEALSYLTTGAVTTGHCKVLVALDDAELQNSLARRCAEEGLSVRQLEIEAKRYRETVQPDKVDRPSGRGSTPGKSDKPPHIRELEENLQRLFSARVKVVEQGGKGSLTVFFDSSGEFQSIIGRMDQLLRQEG